MATHRTTKAFTLIELSIVLVIIGLIVGGVLVGRDLVSAAAVRAQIAQIESYNSAVNTFRTKYRYLPGDIPNPDAASFGFVTRGTGQGQGDGNGIIEGAAGTYPQYDHGVFQGGGETGMFWVDLSTATLVDGGFNTANPLTPPATPVTMPDIGKYMPSGRIGLNRVYVYSDSGNNFFGLSTPYDNVGNSAWRVISAWASFYSSPGLTVKQAYAIDQKTDDGLPQSGSVIAMIVQDLFNPIWVASPYGTTGASPGTAATASATTCFDNGNNSSAPMNYSIATNNGMGMNCGLSFKFR